MKFNKIISALTAIAMSVASWQCFSALAAEGTEVLKYTFDSETKVTRNYADVGDLTFSCYDGQTAPFLYTSDGSWASGWFRGETGDSDGRVPSEKGMNIASGKLNVNLLQDSFMRMCIPTTGGTGEKSYMIKFTMEKTGGTGRYMRMGIDEKPVPDEANETTTNRKGGMLADFASGTAVYSKTVSLSADKAHYLAFVLPYSDTLSFAIDEITITEVLDASVSKTVPASGAENVTTYVYPKVYFSSPIDSSTALHISLKTADGETVETTNNVDSDGMIVTLETKKPLNGTETYTINVPDAVKCADGSAVKPYESTFTTAAENVVISYDFEREGNVGDNGMLFKPGTWASTLSMTGFDGKNVLKMDVSQQWGNAKLQMTDTSINNLCIEGNNINRTYLIEFDVYTAEGGKAYIRFYPVWDGAQDLGTYTQTGQWIHIEKTVNFTTCWNPYVEICNSAAATPIYIDNFKVTDLSAAAEKPSVIRMIKDRGEYTERDITDSGAIEPGEICAFADKLQNTSGRDIKLALVQSLYKEGILVEIAMDAVDVAASDTEYKTLETKLTVPDNGSGDYCLKAFLWDMNTFCPIASKTVLEPYDEVHIQVAKDGSGDYDNISAANNSITDSSAYKRYIIDIAPGTYEEIDLTPKAYVTLRGTSSDECIIKGELPDSTSATAQGRNQIMKSSTINMKPTGGLENLTITARNLRYPVHDEGSGSNPDIVRYVKNCHIEHFGNKGATDYYIDNGYGTNRNDVWQWTTAWGYGSASGVIEVFENTTFKSVQRAWYVHNNKNFTRRQVNILNNCHMISGEGQDITVESLGSTTDDLVVLNNCTFDGLFIRSADFPWNNTDLHTQYATRRDYDIILNDCDPLGYKPDNLGRALRIVSNSTQSNSQVEISGTAAQTLFGNSTAKPGGGGISGYTYGEWDISGSLVGADTSTYVYNTIGRRLDNCSNVNKELTLIFDGDASKKVNIVFNENYFTVNNEDMLAKINEAISEYGYADIYNVTANEYYPTFTDKERVLENGSTTAIKRFAAVCIENGKARPMTAEDSADSFAGIALENIVPGQSGRILSEGYLYNEQLGLDTVANGAVITVKENGYELNGSSAAVMNCTNDYGWAYFKAN
ncbi:MAG: pectinesterase family protein [Clostridiales bacterium]|nr:pectinesterase family protein [Clostridiales bacterium]